MTTRPTTDAAESSDQGSYHHGNLQNALLDAVGEIIAEKGVGGVSLREAARRAGVSHGAPAHHFGDKLGLLTAYSTRGFDLFGDRMLAAVTGVETAEDQINAVGLEYLRFAVEERAYFELMFRSDMHKPDNPGFDGASTRAFSVLLEIAGRLPANDPPQSGEQPDAVVFALRAWSMVHGLATLWLDGAMGKFWDGDDIYELALRIFESEIPTDQVPTSG